jgi:hypothetical protein
VGAGAGTVGEGSHGSMHSRPVRDPGTRGMLSGPVSELSRGPVYQPQRPRYGDSISETSAGAVKHDTASPLGERISQPLRELGPLQEEMRRRREQAERAALTAATEPVAAAHEDAAALALEPPQPFVPAARESAEPAESAHGESDAPAWDTGSSPR